MIYLILVVLLIVCIKYVYDNKLIIRLDTIFRKGFKLQKDVYGVYCFTGKQRLSGKHIQFVIFLMS